LRQRWGTAKGERTPRVETLPWAAARILAYVNPALVAIEDGADIEKIRAVDRAILRYGTAVLDAAQARAGRSYANREKQRGSAAARKKKIRTGERWKYPKIITEADRELAFRERQGLSVRGFQSAVAKTIGCSAATVSRALALGEIPKGALHVASYLKRTGKKQRS
jgi:hypothetical protein